MAFLGVVAKGLHTPFSDVAKKYQEAFLAPLSGMACEQRYFTSI